MLVRRLARLVRESSDRLVALVESIIAVGGLLLVVAMAIPWVNEPLARVGFADGATVTQLVLVVVLVSLFFQVRRLAEGINRKEKQELHFSDPLDVYAALEERMAIVDRLSEKRLDVLGMTLYTAWPSVRFLITRPGLTDWTVRFAAYVNHEPQEARGVPSSWSNEAAANLDGIMSACRSAPVARSRTTLEAFSFDFAPAVHGFRLGNGDLFMSMLLWDGKQLCLDDYSYDFTPFDDRSPSAEAARRLFDSWFTRASQQPWVPREAEACVSESGGHQ